MVGAIRERRPYGSLEGRLERQKRFQRNMYGGGFKGEGVKPSVGRLPKAVKAIDNIIQTLNREGNEFTYSQGMAVAAVIEAKLNELRQAVQANGKPD
jgi:hypothetical protein